MPRKAFHLGDVREYLIARVAIGDRATFSCRSDKLARTFFGVALRVRDDRASAEGVDALAFGGARPLRRLSLRRVLQSPDALALFLAGEIAGADDALQLLVLYDAAELNRRRGPAAEVRQKIGRIDGRS